jgi:hypothetical protein
MPRVLPCDCLAGDLTVWKTMEGGSRRHVRSGRGVVGEREGGGRRNIEGYMYVSILKENHSYNRVHVGFKTKDTFAKNPSYDLFFSCRRKNTHCYIHGMVDSTIIGFFF